MTLAVLQSRALAGMAAPPVNVEVHLANGLPGWTIVGLPDTEVREAKDRVRAALQNSGFDIPPRRITINLAQGVGSLRSADCAGHPGRIAPDPGRCTGPLRIRR
jgi:hypothetical protein